METLTLSQEEVLAEAVRRPPLFVGDRTGNIILDCGAALVFVELGPLPDGGEPQNWFAWFRILAPYPGLIVPARSLNRRDRRYTGPITPAMWDIIRRHWK